MGYRDNLYDLVLVLHLLAVVVGFGPFFLGTAIYGRAAEGGGPAGLAIGRATMKLTAVSDLFIYAVFVTGILLVILSDDVIPFSDMWISISMLLYFAGIAVSHAMLRPAGKRMLALQEELAGAGPPAGGGRPRQVDEIEAAGKRLAMAGMIENLIVVAIVFLMVFKPGAENF
ncbi:MAG TPA: DUF2269 family protein [Acidimicrobiales bacterium]|nr:DUF2269 family protein [Acidimicrobiales bacterium]